jgi:hypothetical protein
LARPAWLGRTWCDAISDRVPKDARFREMVTLARRVAQHM